MVWDNFGNYIFEVFDIDKNMFKGLANYSIAPDKRIGYFDLLAVPERYESFDLGQLRINN